MKFLPTALVIILIIALSSCGTQKYSMETYVDNTKDTIGKNAVKIPEVRIQKGDQLSIQVYSATLNPETDIPYNLANLGGTSGESTQVTGFLVDQNGNIEYPRIGTLHVEGMTKQQLADKIEQQFSGNGLTDPSVLVRFLNYRITVLGEVANPTSLNVPGERITILEALGMAGDITQDGIKSNVKVIRETGPDREIGTIDLTKTTLFESPYYYLQQNDVVYVETSERTRKREDDARTRLRLQIALSLMNAAVLIYNLFIR